MFKNHYIERLNNDVEAVEYFLLPLLSTKCFRFHKNLTASASLSSHVLWKMLPLPAAQKVKCFRLCFQLLSSKCFHFHKNLTASASLVLKDKARESIRRGFLGLWGQRISTAQRIFRLFIQNNAFL